MSSSTSPGSFIFEPSADHCELPSFPTRRSSDLQIAEAASKTVQAQNRGLTNRPEIQALVQTMSDRTKIIEREIARSEEHTSELQSLRHLVCRLLLEKKKNRRNQATE